MRLLLLLLYFCPLLYALVLFFLLGMWCEGVYERSSHGAVFVYTFYFLFLESLNKLSIGPLSSHKLEPELIQWWRWWLVREIFQWQTTTVSNFGVRTPWSISTASILKQFSSWKSNCLEVQCGRQPNGKGFGPITLLSWIECPY